MHRKMILDDDDFEDEYDNKDEDEEYTIHNDHYLQKKRVSNANINPAVVIKCKRSTPFSTNSPITLSDDSLESISKSTFSRKKTMKLKGILKKKPAGPKAKTLLEKCILCGMLFPSNWQKDKKELHMINCNEDCGIEEESSSSIILTSEQNPFDLQINDSKCLMCHEAYPKDKYEHLTDCAKTFFCSCSLSI